MEKNAQDTVERMPSEPHQQAEIQIDEKKHQHAAPAYSVEVESEKDTGDDSEVLDPFRPFPIDLSQPDEGNILTVRAVALGCALGALVNASNLYLGLKTGWLFGANLFGALVGFAVLKSLSRSPLRIPGLTDHFGPMENNIVQTSAAAAGGMGIIFVGGIPALYHLNLMSENPKDDFGKLVAITFCASMFGISFSVPLRRFFIIDVARELNLIFPTATATAVSIRAMHSTAGDAYIQAKKKIKALGISFGCSFGLRFVSQYCVGILWDWHVMWWIYSIAKTSGVPAPGAIQAQSWGWFIEFTPAFIGSGLLVGLNSAFSLFFGGVFSWGLVGPLLVKYEAAFGDATSIPGLMKYGNMNVTDLDKVSPRYWLLWPGVFAMILVSMAELAFNYKIIGAGFFAAYKNAVGFIGRLRNRDQPVQSDTDSKDEDIFSSHEQVPIWMWGSLAGVTSVLICVILGTMYHTPVGVSIIAILFAFVFSFLAIQCTGASDTTPVSTVAKASQLVTGGVTKGMNISVKAAQTINLMSGCVAGAAASQSTDLINDFKVGYLLRTPPRKQWFAQILGSVVAVFMAPGMFILFATAYPCILVPGGGDGCAFGAPSIAAWRAVTEAVTSPRFPVPRGSAIFSLVFGIICVLISLARHVLHLKGKSSIAAWLPNPMIFSLALTLPYTQYGTAMIMGAGVAGVWQRKWPKHWEMYGTSIASGLIAGEGIGGVVNALFEVVKIGGGHYGTGFGCPKGQC
ncbi:hypothetical protein TWF696_009440 [Orbilia brochopaga]|uniref:Oligopeptide transporter n=1 Tax=Orbilia brochopaga TaxID=3140254 RepID=A0AAV9UCW0_9PEZI